MVYVSVCACKVDWNPLISTMFHTLKENDAHGQTHIDKRNRVMGSERAEEFRDMNKSFKSKSKLD